MFSDAWHAVKRGKCRHGSISVPRAPSSVGIGLAAEVRSAVAAVAGKVDYTYRRPSRRAHLNPEVVLPTLRRPIPDVAIVCDTSMWTLPEASTRSVHG
jgi:hypothetical protein